MDVENDNVVEFIRRRFPSDCNWLNGNCYYFAVILKARFPEGTILYDQVDGHFVVDIGGTLYDWTGAVRESPGPHSYVAWDEFDDIDRLQHRRIVRDCVM